MSNARKAANTRGPITGFGTLRPSGNVKLAGQHTQRKVFATYRPVGPTCPSDCALLGNGCYAQGGQVNMHQTRSGGQTFDAYAWAMTLPQDALIRWNVSGDVVGSDGPMYRESIKAVHIARPDLAGWLYTHAWDDMSVASWAASLPENVRCVASVDNDADVPRAQAMGWRTVATVTSTTDGQSFTDAEARSVKGERVESAGYEPGTGEYIGGRIVGSVRPLPCPAQRTSLGCADCLGCMRDGHVVFAVHGQSTKRAQAAIAKRRLPVLN